LKDLYRCLAEHPPQLVDALAEVWHVPPSDAEGLERVAVLGDAMLAPLRLEQVVESLSSDARQALSLLVSCGGALPARRLAAFGTIRRFGPARLMRERPWTAPDNPIEELFYRGLVYRAYGSAEDQLDEIILVPDQLLERLGDLLGTTPEEASLLYADLDTIHHVQVSQRALCEDLLAILVAARTGRVRPYRPEEDPAATPTLRPQDLDLGRRLCGPRSVEYLALLQRMLVRLRLIRVTDRTVQPTLRAREWLRLSDLRRTQTLVVSWRDDPHWDDLCHLEGLRVEGSPPEGRLVAVRRGLIEILATLPQQDWVGLDSFVGRVRRLRPDLLRKQGELSWSIRDAETERYLDGMETWDRVEGELIGHLVTHALYWLGLVDLGLTREGAVVAFRLADMAGVLLEALQGGGELPEEDAIPAPAEVADDLTVRIPVTGTMYTRYQIERFAEWLGQEDVAVYRITPESVWRVKSAEISIEQILSFLRRISEGRASPAALRTLGEWAEHYGMAYLRRLTLLETVDEATMRRIEADPWLLGLLGERLAPHLRAVPEESVEAVADRLRELGIWPIAR